MVPGAPSGSASDRVVEPLAAGGRARCPRQSGAHYFVSAQSHSDRHDHAAYRNKSNTGLVTKLVHLSFLLAVQKTVLVLHADELCPAVLLGAILVSTCGDDSAGTATYQNCIMANWYANMELAPM